MCYIWNLCYGAALNLVWKGMGRARWPAQEVLFPSRRSVHLFFFLSFILKLNGLWCNDLLNVISGALTIGLSAPGLMLQCDRSPYTHTHTHALAQTQRAQIWEEVSMPTAVSLAEPSNRLTETEIITESITSIFLECMCIDSKKRWSFSFFCIPWMKGWFYSDVHALLINFSGSFHCILHNNYCLIRHFSVFCFQPEVVSPSWRKVWCTHSFVQVCQAWFGSLCRP